MGLIDDARAFRASISGMAQYAPDEMILDEPMAFDKWKSGVAYAVGDVRRDEEGLLYRCLQAHTSQSGWNPSAAPALWTQYHGTSYATARPFVHPTGAHDIYLYDEYMIFTDSKVYRCVSTSGTAYSPTEYAAAWEEATT